MAAVRRRRCGAGYRELDEGGDVRIAGPRVVDKETDMATIPTSSTTAPSIKSVGDLSEAERLLLLRRRRQLTQREAADLFEVSHSAIYHAEEGRRPIPENILTHLPKSGGLKDYERYFFMRRRLGLTRRYVAERAGCSTLWVSWIELGRAPTNKLANYWGN